MEDQTIADVLYAEISNILGIIQKRNSNPRATDLNTHDQIISKLSEEIDHHYYEDEFSSQVVRMTTILDIFDTLQIPAQCHREDVDIIVGKYRDLCP
jgi:hypothetical protein